MKSVRRGLDRLVLPLVVVLGAGSASNSSAIARCAEVVVKDVTGTASYSSGGGWQPLKKDMTLSQGATIRTETNSTVDLVLNASLTALRLTPNSTLRLDKLSEEAGLDACVTDTTLTLLAGSLAGTQRKLAAPSRFRINVAGKVATIVGTEYYIRADGAVTVTSGAVTINWNNPGAGGDVNVTVPAGYSFNPATGRVVPTTPVYLQNIIAHINTTKHNAQTFKIGRATLVVKPEEFISPH